MTAQRESTSQKHMDVTRAQAVPQPCTGSCRPQEGNYTVKLYVIGSTDLQERLNLAEFFRTCRTCECAGAIITHPKAAQGKGASSSSPWTRGWPWEGLQD